MTRFLLPSIHLGLLNLITEASVGVACSLATVEGGGCLGGQRAKEEEDKKQMDEER